MTYDEAIEATVTKAEAFAEIRSVIRAAAHERGCRYRITRDGEVHFYGPMPNTDDVGWYFVGWSPEEVVSAIDAGRIV